MDFSATAVVTEAALVGKIASTRLIAPRFGVKSAREIEQALLRFSYNALEIKGEIFNAAWKKQLSLATAVTVYEHKSHAK